MQILKAVIDAVTRQPQMRAENHQRRVARVRPDEAIFFYGLVTGLLAWVL